jgi:DNA-binding GntR family transcriptional regulator
MKKGMLSDQVREYLIRQISTGNLKGGDRVVEMKVASELDVSQSSVREALRDLEKMGLVAREAFRGTKVRDFSDQDMIDVYNVRAALESLGATLALKNMTDDDYASLDNCVNEMVRHAKLNDVEGMVSWDVAFHERIISRSANWFLILLWRLMEPTLWTSATVRLKTVGLEDLAIRHVEVIKVLREGNTEAVGQVMRSHILEFIMVLQGMRVE